MRMGSSSLMMRARFVASLTSRPRSSGKRRGRGVAQTSLGPLISANKRADVLHLERFVDLLVGNAVEEGACGCGERPAGGEHHPVRLIQAGLLEPSMEFYARHL